MCFTKKITVSCYAGRFSEVLLFLNYILSDLGFYVIIIHILIFEYLYCANPLIFGVIKLKTKINFPSLIHRYEGKRLEIETWLSRMENRSDRMGVVATTADVLEAQQKEQKVGIQTKIMLD